MAEQEHVQLLRLRLVEGDGDALSETYDLYAGVVFGLALRVTKDRTLAEDVTQETFIALWEQPERFDPERGSLRAFLCTIAHRRAVDTIRRSETQRRTAAAAATVTSTAKDNTPGIEDSVIGDDEQQRVHLALLELPPEQNAALRLAYLDGYTYREVASALDIPEGTAKSRIRLALKQLSKTLHLEEVGI